MKKQYDTKYHIIVLKLITAQNDKIQPNPATAKEQMKFISRQGICKRKKLIFLTQKVCIYKNELSSMPVKS